MNRIIQAFFLAILTTAPVFGQEPDSIYAEPDTLYSARGDTISGVGEPLRAEADTLTTVEPDLSHSPKKAIMYALVLPGLGQAYNKKFYKMPIVWAAFGGAGYAISYNSRNYRAASTDYALLQDDLNERYLQFWRRNLELSYIALLAVYALQVIDAYVDAQLYNWDVTENLAIGVSPSLQPLMFPAGNHVYGLTCSINLKKLW